MNEAHVLFLGAIGLGAWTMLTAAAVLYLWWEEKSGEKARK